MPKSETNELYQIWRHVFKLDKEYITKEYRKEQRFKRYKFFKYDRDIIQYFWDLKSKFNALNEEIEMLENRDPLEGYEPYHDEGRD